MNQKQKKDVVFREIESMKTTIRLISSRIGKSGQGSSPIKFKYPIKVSFCLLGGEAPVPEGSKGLKYSVDNGSQIHMSSVSEDASW